MISSLLIASILGLLVGPTLFHIRVDLRTWRSVLDGFAMATIAGLAAFHFIPEALSHGGWLALVFLIAGALLPLAFERSARLLNVAVAEFVLLVGLPIHAALESAALGAAPLEKFAGLGIAIAAHRLPVGLILFAVIRRRYGQLAGWGAIGLMIVATLIGFYTGGSVQPMLEGQGYAFLQAMVGGALLHVVFSHHLEDDSILEEQHCCHDDHCQSSSTARERKMNPAHVAAASGALLGAGVVATTLALQPAHRGVEGTRHFTETFIHLALESAPALLIAYLLAGVMSALINPARAQWLGRGSSISQALRGVVFGLPLPICSCGVLPFYETLVRRGVPATAAMAFLIATPELGIDAVLLSIPLLGGKLAFARLVAAFVVALVVALVVGRMVSSPVSEPVEESESSQGPLLKRLLEGLEFGLVDLFDHTMPWVVFGLLIAAVAEPVFGVPFLRELPASIQVPLFAAIGIPLYVCASGATPIAAVAIAQGVSPGAALAFLIAGPATNVTTFGILSSLHGRRGAVLFGLAVLVGAMTVGWSVDALPWTVATEVDLHEHGATLSWGFACLMVLMILFLASLFRQGPRGILEQITRPIEG